MLDPLCQLRQFDPGQVFLDGRMGRRLADEQEMPARRPNNVADRLAGVEIVAEIDWIEPCIARSMCGEPALCRHSLFFFSSRRRHTRLTCDWSSDVCSS